MIKRILKWTGIVLLILILGVTITTASRQHLKYEAPYPAIKASLDTAVIAHGKHLVQHIAACVDCHGKGNVDSLLKAGADITLTGGNKFDLPFGAIYTKNITPDKETGVGNMTDAEIARALRYSVHPNGEVVYGFMSYHNLSDEDLTAVISYLRSLKPEHNKVPDHQLNILGNLVKAFMVKPEGPKGPVPIRVSRDSSSAYGKYLVMNVANCYDCHSKRDAMGNLTGELLAGGNEPEDTSMRALTPPNLTTDSSSRIFGWSQDDFIKRFRMGKLMPQSYMPWSSFSHMSDLELKAIYKYLKTLKPVKTSIVKRKS